MSDNRILERLEKSEQKIRLIVDNDNKGAKRELKTLKSVKKGEIDNLRIPQISIKQFSIKPLTELDTNVNIVKTKEEHLKIPQFNLAKFTLSKINSLDTAILIKHETDEKLLIPQLKIKTFNPISTCSNLNTEFEITVEQQSIKIPQLLLMRFKQIQPYERFLTDKPVQPESHSKEEKTKEEIVETSTESSSKLEGYGELDYLLEEISKFINIIRIGGVAGYSKDRPICIILPKVVNDSYIYTVALICRELYRIREEGLPISRMIATVTEGSKEEIENLLKGESRIFIIDDSQSKLLPLDGGIRTASDSFNRVNKAKLFERLGELFSQGYGFIIFHLDSRWSGDFAKLLKREVGYKIHLVELESQPLPFEVKKELSSICWGFVRIKSWSKFDEFFGWAEKTYYEKLDSVLNDVELRHYITFDKSEGKEHKALKMMAIEALAKEIGAKSRKDIIKMLEEGKIRSEYEFEFGRADVFTEHRGKQIFVEIETFYGTENPIEKLDCERSDGTVGTLRKYLKYVEELNRKNIKIIVVILGLHMLLFMEGLLKLRKIYREKYDINVDFNFYTIDVENKRFISLEEILKLLKHLKKISEEVKIREISEP